MSSVAAEIGAGGVYGGGGARNSGYVRIGGVGACAMAGAGVAATADAAAAGDEVGERTATAFVEDAGGEIGGEEMVDVSRLASSSVRPLDLRNSSFFSSGASRTSAVSRKSVACVISSLREGEAAVSSVVWMGSSRGGEECTVLRSVVVAAAAPFSEDPELLLSLLLSLLLLLGSEGAAGTGGADDGDDSVSARLDLGGLGSDMLRVC